MVPARAAGDKVGGKCPVFATQCAQAVHRIERAAAVCAEAPVLIITDNWFGNSGLSRPLRAGLGARARFLSHLHVNSALHDLPAEPAPGSAGRSRKYGTRTGNAGARAILPVQPIETYTVPLHDKLRGVEAT